MKSVKHTTLKMTRQVVTVVRSRRYSTEPRHSNSEGDNSSIATEAANLQKEAGEMLQQMSTANLKKWSENERKK